MLLSGAYENEKPAIRNINRVIIIDGIVVIIKYLICSNRGVPEEDEAITVVSDKGDILSPKYAPDIIAPAIHGVGNPIPYPIPINATPIVAIVVHELPVITETIAEVTQHIRIKNLGSINCNQ